MYAAKGVRSGDRIGVVAHNHPTTVISLFALARLGAIMVPVNPEFRVTEMRYVLEHARVSGVLCSPSVLQMVNEACSGIEPNPWIILNESADEALPVFSQLLAMQSSKPPHANGNSESVCVFIYTSGTTGFPKGVMHSQKSLVMAGEAFVQRMYLTPEERLMCVLPMFHINAICYSLMGAIASGAVLILEPRFSASNFWKIACATRATEVNIIAAISNILMRRPRSEFFAEHCLRKIYGAPFSEDIYRVFQSEFNVPTLIEGYGMSEIPGALNNPFPGPHKIGSMGKLSTHPDPKLSLTEVKIVDDGRREVPPGKVGELMVRTPIVMKGYYRDSEATEKALRGGWFTTGDLGWRDEDGYYWFVARKADIIRRRGENISGAEIDRVVESHPNVVQAASIPVPAELGEDEILVAIVTNPGATLTALEISEWCRAQLAEIKVPRFVTFLDDLPRTSTHRVEKFKLRADKSLRERAVDLAASDVKSRERLRTGGSPV